MSNYNQEDATFTLPSKDYRALKKAIRSQANELREELWQKVLAVHDRLVAATKGRRIANKRVVLQQYDIGFTRLNCLQESDFISADGKRLVKPTRVSFNRAVKPITNRCNHFSVEGSESSIFFDDQRRQVTWSVELNNKSVESARGHALGVTFWRHIERITWTKGTGGTVVRWYTVMNMTITRMKPIIVRRPGR